MSFDQILREMQIKLREQYGDKREITKIGVSRELFYAIITEMHQKNDHILIEKINEFSMYGIDIVIREKENFWWKN